MPEWLPGFAKQEKSYQINNKILGSWDLSQKSDEVCLDLNVKLRPMRGGGGGGGGKTGEEFLTILQSVLIP